MSSTYAVVNPATGETVREFPEISDDELRAAIGRAEKASRTWPSAAGVTERAELVRKVGELHTERRAAGVPGRGEVVVKGGELHPERRQQLAEIIVREMGKPIEQALGEVDF